MLGFFGRIHDIHPLLIVATLPCRVLAWQRGFDRCFYRGGGVGAGIGMTDGSGFSAEPGADVSGEMGCVYAAGGVGAGTAIGVIRFRTTGIGSA